MSNVPTAVDIIVVCGWGGSCAVLCRAVRVCYKPINMVTSVLLWVLIPLVNANPDHVPPH